MLSGGEAAAGGDPPAGGECGAPHDARSPDVTVDSAFVTETVGEAGLSKEFVELRLVRHGDFVADLGDASADIQGGHCVAGNRNADGLQERVGQFERGRLGDVEAVDQSVAD